MNGFYVSLVFFGALLVIFSLLCIFLDKKNTFSFARNYNEKKQELVEIIHDAEHMIEELNRFSDYIVNQMDLKNEEMSKNLKNTEEKVSVLSEKARSICMEAPVSVAVNGGTIGATDTVATYKFNSDFTKLSPKKSEKVIRLNNKYSEVIRLSKEGMMEFEIARRLNIGKGEVELILGLTKH